MFKRDNKNIVAVRLSQKIKTKKIKIEYKQKKRVIPTHSENFKSGTAIEGFLKLGLWPWFIYFDGNVIKQFNLKIRPLSFMSSDR